MPDGCKALQTLRSSWSEPSVLTSGLDFGIAFSFEPWALIISLQLGGAFCLTFLGVLLREEFESLWYAILHAIEVSHSPSDNILL